MIAIKRFNMGAKDVEDNWQVWRNIPNNKHAWAFIHYCRRLGDKIYIKNKGDKISLEIKRKI